MEKHTITQEILLVIKSSFAQRDLCSGDHGINQGKALSPEERLEEACWNGLMDEFIDGAPLNRKNGKLFLWKIHAADKFLCIEMSQFPGELEPFYSLDPHFFLGSKNKN